MKEKEEGRKRRRRREGSRGERGKAERRWKNASEVKSDATIN